MTTSYIARTGRVQSWLDDPTSRLPVSCTVLYRRRFNRGENGIEASWKFVSHALRMEQAARSTCRNCDPKEQKMTKGWLHLDQSPLQKSTQP